jgi:hypothetical protein
MQQLNLNTHLPPYRRCQTAVPTDLICISVDYYTDSMPRDRYAFRYDSHAEKT